MVILFQKAVALYRYLSSEAPLDAMVLRIADTTPLLLLLSRDSGGWNTAKLKKIIDNSFKLAGVPEGNEVAEQDLVLGVVPSCFCSPSCKKAQRP